MPRIGIYGWGVVAPRCPDVDSFAANLESSETWLSPFDGFGPSTFLVGEPSFDFEDYRPWIDERFPPNKFPQLRSKMGMTTQFAIGAFVQSLRQNPGIETTLQELGADAQVMVGTGLGEFPIMYEVSVELYCAQRRWDGFWAAPEHNADRDRFEQSSASEREELRQRWGVPERPAERQYTAFDDPLTTEWNRFWLQRSDGLAGFLEKWDAIESQGVSGDIESGKLRLIRRKRTALDRLRKEWGCPTPPWLAVSSTLLWNIHNTPAAQISMLGKITGAAFAPVAACSTFGLSLHLAMQAIRCGEARAVVIGGTDPPPHSTSVGTFYAARVLAGDRSPSLPLTDLRGTHVAGGACVWIVADDEFMRSRGHEPIGLELLGVGVSSDADHIITPSREGPQEAIRRALRDARITADEISNWDLHATATPGDYQEVDNLRPLLRDGVIVTARKGTFGHGMSAGGGWELMAQHLGIVNGRLYPAPLSAAILNEEIAELPFRYVMDQGCEPGSGSAGKLSMGIGGINACIISRPW